MNRSPVSPMSSSGHVATEALLRRLDQAATPEEMAAIEHHLVACENCRNAAERMERQSRDLGVLLAKAYPAVPATWHAPVRRTDRSSWWWAIAAILATVMAVGAVAPPVRAWVVERLQSIIQGGDDRTPVAAGPGGAPVVQADSPDSAGNIVVFQPDEAEFAIDVSRLITGRLILTVSARGAATAEVLRGVPPEIVVLPNGLRVRAESALEADLEINLPATVRRIVVRRDGRLVGRYHADSSAGPERAQRWELQLGRQ